MRLRYLTSLWVLMLANRGAHAIWPRPRSMTSGTRALRLSSNFTIVANFESTPDIDAAISRTESFIRTDRLGRLVVGRGSSDAPSIQAAPQLDSLALSLNGPVSNITTESQKPPSERDESYSLSVPSDGSAAGISANSSLGLLRGLTTFSQIWYDLGDETYTLNTPISIEDSPKFPYRGLMLDTARNFFQVPAIKRTLDSMSWVKINTFHWHVTDSQSFPLQVSGFLELSNAGAYSNSSIYTLSDIQDIVNYAGQRGIDVLVEVDSPGHSAAIGESHPEHIACFHASPWSSFAGEPPSGQLRITSAATTNFTASLFSAIANMMPSYLVSTGGDEINEACYASDPETQAALNATGMTIEQALSNFTQATHGALKAAGKTPVVWEEMVLEHNVTLSNDTIAIVWISSQNAAAVASKGFRLIHGPSDYFYLDCGAGEWLGNDISGNSWCDPFKTWQKAYSFDPFANLTTEQQSLVLGGQQLLWTEQSSPQNLDSIVWPRAAASAEVFWTGGTLADGGRNVSEALSRLHEIRYRMVQRGINAIPLQPEWCAIRPGQCDG